MRQKELAWRLGYEPSYLSALERSRKGPPRQDFILRLIRGLELSEEEIRQLHQAVQDSRRHVVLPVWASDDEYALIRLLERQLGRLSPAQIRMMEFALQFTEASSGKEGRTM